MFRKAGKGERRGSDQEHFEVGLYRAVWRRSCRLAKLSRNGWCGDQCDLCRVASHRATSSRPAADDSPSLPEAEASSAGLRRCRTAESNRFSANCRPCSHGRADDENSGGTLHTSAARGRKGCAAQSHCFGAALYHSPLCTYFLVARGPSSRRRQHIVGTVGGTRGAIAKIDDRVP